MMVAENLSKGNMWKRKYKVPQCKIVQIVLGEEASCLEEIKIGVEMKLPIIIVKGSPLCDKIIGYLNHKETMYNERVERILDEGKFYILDNDKSEDIAGFVHFFLTCTPF
jgi:hypothetical protein